MFKEGLQGLSPEVRRTYKILKNAGYINEDVEKKKENLRTEDFITAVTGEAHENEAKDKQKYHAFIRENNLHKNKKFQQYAKKYTMHFFIVVINKKTEQIAWSALFFYVTFR